jgi:hypothetical protein
MRIGPKYRRVKFFVHTDNSTCHNGRKNTADISDAKLESLPHPPYSPDLSLGDFWLFGMSKHEMKDWLFQTIEDFDYCENDMEGLDL